MPPIQADDCTPDTKPPDKPVIHPMQAQHALIQADRAAREVARKAGADPLAVAALTAQPLIIGGITFEVPSAASLLAQQDVFNLYQAAGKAPHILATAGAFSDPRGLFAACRSGLPAVEEFLFDLAEQIPLNRLPDLNAWAALQMRLISGDSGGEETTTEEGQPGPLASAGETPPA